MKPMKTPKRATKVLDRSLRNRVTVCSIAFAFIIIFIKALAPVNDPIRGDIISIFGIDFSVSEWYTSIWERMIPGFIVIFLIMVLFFSLIYILILHSRLNNLSKKNASDEAFYHNVFDQTPIGIAIVNDKSFLEKAEFGYVSINPMFENILGRGIDELRNLKWPEITHPVDLAADLEKFERFKNGEINGYTMEKRFIKNDGSVVWTNMKISALTGLGLSL